MLHLTRTKSFRIAAIALALIGLYAWAGFVFAPKLLRSALMENIPQMLGATPAVGEIRINPFLLQVEVKDFSLSSVRGDRLLGFRRFFVDFELSSIWHGAYSFAAIHIDSPYVNAIVSDAGNLNLLQLRVGSAPAKPDQQKVGPIPALRIRSFKVSQGLVTYDDRSRPSDFAVQLQPINFELVDFTTGGDGGRFTLTGSSRLGERIEWHGHVAVQPIESDGEFRIDGLRAHTIWTYMEDRLSFAVGSGSIDVNGTYRFSLTHDLDLHVAIASAAVSDLRIRPKDSQADWITVPSLVLAGTTLDVGKRRAHAESLSIRGAKLVAWLEPDGSINLLSLAAAPKPAAPSDAPSPRPAPAMAQAVSRPPWQFDLRRFELSEASISAEDRTTHPAAKVLLAPLSLQVDGASLDLAKPLHVAFTSRINESGSLSIDGELTPQPLRASVGLKLGDIDLTMFQPYIAQRTSMTLLGGRLSGEGKARYGFANPAAQFTGNLTVANLHTVDNALRDDFINWDRLDVQGLDFQHLPDRVDIDQIVARKAYARVIIEPDTSLNVSRVMAGPGAVVVVPGAAGTSATPLTVSAPAPPPSTRIVDARGRAAPAKPAPPGQPPMPMAIKKIELQDSEANFADLSVIPNFSTGIRQLHGSVNGLSSKVGSRAKVDLHGAVDAFSPVAVTGEANVLSAALYTDLALSFRNMELSTFNPYSGKFAGYNITQGKLTTELHYKVNGRKLDAQHHISIDQLEFGDKTASKDAVSLPVKLAVALLKDRNGLIELDIPVSGTLDDPKFRLGPVIWTVFVNILEKAATAPFALLGSLFGGGPDLQFIDFDPGAASLDGAGADKVRAIAKALNERPQLKVEVPIATAELDRAALIEAKVATQIRDAQTASGRKRPAGAAPAFDQMDTGAKLELLALLYAKQIGSDPKFPESMTGFKSKPEVDAAKLEFLTRALHDHVVVADDDLQALGQQRAVAVQAALLNDTQVEPARVFLVANDKARQQNGRVQLELSLK